MQLKRQTVPMGGIYLLASPILLYWLCHTGSGLCKPPFYLANWHQCQALPTRGGNRGKEGLEDYEETSSPLCELWAPSLRFRCASPQQSFLTNSRSFPEQHFNSVCNFNNTPRSQSYTAKQCPLPSCLSFSSKESSLQASNLVFSTCYTFSLNPKKQMLPAVLSMTISIFLLPSYLHSLQTYDYL